MKVYDVVEESVLPAAPAAVFDMLGQVFTGRRNTELRKARTLEVTPHGQEERVTVGMTADVLAHTFGRPRFTAVVTGVEEDRRIDLRFTHGDFTGRAVWTLARASDGTRLRTHWIAHPGSRAMDLLGREALVERAHKKLMQRFFRRVASLLLKDAVMQASAQRATAIAESA